MVNKADKNKARLNTQRSTVARKKFRVLQSAPA